VIACAMLGRVLKGTAPRWWACCSAVICQNKSSTTSSRSGYCVPMGAARASSKTEQGLTSGVRASVTRQLVCGGWVGVWWWEGGRRRRRGEGHLLRARAFSRGRALRGTASEDGATWR